MDPNTALAMVREAFASGNYLSGAIAFAALDDWLKSGGFKPADWDVNVVVPQ